jgi:uncharacterized protein YndB with AHSA1/START domain
MPTAKTTRKSKASSKGKGRGAGPTRRSGTSAKSSPPKVRSKARSAKPTKKEAIAARVRSAATQPSAAPKRSAAAQAVAPVFEGPALELETIRQEILLPSPPHVVFDAYVDGAQHAAFTGSPAESAARVGGRFRAYDGYIDGVFLELVRGRRIVQSWRATDFPPEYPHSRLELALEPEGAGTRLVMRHSEVPRSMAPAYAQGWQEFYWQPLRRYLAAR